MTVKPYIKLFLITAVLTFYTACKSYEIPYDSSLDSKTISTGFYVNELPAPYVSYNAGGLVALAKAGLHSGDISKAYIDADLRGIIYEEFTKNGNTISPKIKTFLKSPADKEIVINQVEPAKQTDPKVSEFIFEGVPEKLGKEYIFILKVLDYGMREGSFSVFSRITYVASIINMNTNTKIWQIKADKEVTYPLELGYSSQKDPLKVRSNLRDCVAGIIRDVSAKINSVQKKETYTN
ncbi:MAG TPA: hypothetical protein PKG60_01170 [Spirochaetota bacterium]|nr:hypothetical protein [Spirochaetota bacterium]